MLHRIYSSDLLRMGRWVTMGKNEKRFRPSYEWTYEWYRKEELFYERYKKDIN